MQNRPIPYGFQVRPELHLPKLSRLQRPLILQGSRRAAIGSPCVELFIKAPLQTRLVHGPAALSRAQRATEVLFSKDADYRQFSAQELREAFHGAPTSPLDSAALDTPVAGLVAVAADAGLYPSRGRARQDVAGGGLSVNNVAVHDANRVLSPADLLPGGYIILRKGKKHYHIVHVAGE